jgi:Tol biopolymer transport system component
VQKLGSSYKRWRIIALLIVITSLVATYYYYYKPIPTTCSLPNVDELILFSARIQTTPFSPTDSLFVMDAETDETWQLICPSVTSPAIAWMPQSQLFSIYDKGGSIDIYSVSPSRTFSQDGSVSGVYYEHSWSFDGTQVVYSSAVMISSARNQEELFVRNNDGFGEQRLTFMPSDEGHPSWSPNSEEIAFESYDRDTAQFNLYKIKADGTGLMLLTEQLDGSSRMPKWSPDGTKIAFLHAGSSLENYHLWIMDVDTAEVKPIFDLLPSKDDFSVGGVYSFAWSPNGKQLVFASGHEGPCNTSSFLTNNTSTTCRTRIYRIKADGTGLVRLTQGHTGSYFDLIWIRFSGI